MHIQAMKSRSHSDCQLEIVPEHRQKHAKTRRNRSFNSDLVPFDNPRKSCLKRSSSQNTFNADDSEDLIRRSPNSSPDAPPKSMRKNVSFHKIEIAEHPYELGDNPSCVGGCPVQIGWEPMDKMSLDVEEYERGKTAPRNKDQLRLPPMIRDQLAKSGGASRSEVEQAIKQAQQITKNRFKSIKARPWDKLHYKLEKTSRTLRKVTSMDGIKRLGKSSQQYNWSTNDLEELEETNKAAEEALSDETVDINEEELNRLKEDDEEPLSF